MTAFDCSLEAIRTLRAHQAGLVRAAHVRALEMVEEAAQRLQFDRTALEAAIDLFDTLKAKAPGGSVSWLEDDIERLNQRWMEAEENLKQARRDAEQVFVSVVSARHACTVLDNYCDQKEHSPQNRMDPEEQHSLASQPRSSSSIRHWN